MNPRCWSYIEVQDRVNSEGRVRAERRSGTCLKRSSANRRIAAVGVRAGKDQRAGARFGKAPRPMTLSEKVESKPFVSIVPPG